MAVIRDEQQAILVTQRPHQVAQGGFWELPGGKLEPQESPEQGLIREIREEVGLEVKGCRILGQVEHSVDSSHSIQFLVFLVTEYTGTPTCLEGQLGLKWVRQDALNLEEFPPANRSIFELIGRSVGLEAS